MSLAEFESKILKTIDAGDLNSALNLIIHFADKISYGKASVITMVNVFGSVILDQLCQRIGSELLKIQAPFLENQHKNYLENGTIQPLKSLIFALKITLLVVKTNHKLWFLTLQEDGKQKNLEKYNAQLLKDLLIVLCSMEETLVKKCWQLELLNKQWRLLI